MWYTSTVYRHTLFPASLSRPSSSFSVSFTHTSRVQQRLWGAAIQHFGHISGPPTWNLFINYYCAVFYLARSEAGGRIRAPKVPKTLWGSRIALKQSRQMPATTTTTRACPINRSIAQNYRIDNREWERERERARETRPSTFSIALVMECLCGATERDGAVVA